MIKKLKKGFTLVELIVVIAIIAILSTVAVIGFTRVVDKANVSNDTQLVRNLNERMQLEEAATGYKKPETAHEAFVLTEDFGFIIEKLTPTSSGNDIVWDMTTNRFALIDAEDHKKVVYSDPTITLSTNPIDLWKVYKEVPIREDQKYSIYLAGTNLNGSVDAKVGVDVGRNTEITEIAYTNPSGDKQEVVIRTNGGVLAVNGPQDTVTHYGFATIVNVDDVKVGTYNEAGTVGRLIYSDNSGAIKFKSTAEVYCYMNISTDAGADANDNTKEAGATVYTNVNAGEQTTAHGYVEGDGKSAVTVTNGIVAVNTCPNHNTDYGVVVVGNREYILCKCCGGFSLYEDGNKIELPAGDPSKSAEIGSGAQSNFDYTSPNHEHSYSDAWSHDEANHWHECECGEISSLAKHTMTYSNNTGDTHDESCTVCGYLQTGVDHVFTNGVCACGKEEVTAPVEVHLTGDIRELREEDHKWNVDGSQYSGQTIGNLELGNGMADSYLVKNGSAGPTYTIHEFELVYTIPENTPQNAIIICDPITEQQYANAVNNLIQPGVSIGYTYKIINESPYDFNITGTEYVCDKIKALSTSDTIVDYKNGDYVLLNSLDNTFYTLTSDNIPNITTGGYMSQYLTWLNGKTTTGYSAVNSGFLEKYKTNYSQTAGYRLIDFINEKVANGTSIDTILDSMSGSNAGNNTNIKHVEGEVIKLLLDFHYRKPVGIVFVKNTKNGWYDNAAVTLSKTMDYTITEFKDWSDFATSGLTVYSAFDLLNNTNVLSYDKIGNTIVGSAIEMWNSFAGNAWQGTTVFSGPIFRITLTANN